MATRKTPNAQWPVKSYRNLDFLNSDDARPIRMLCEFVEPGTRLRQARIRNTICFFGSARVLPPQATERELRKAEAAVEKARSRRARVQVEQAQHARRLSAYYEDAVELARKLTEWSLSIPEPAKRFYICSGGGPGMMEAANRGASLAGGVSLGLNISLPREQTPNPYQTRELAFEFHYFFMRKFWFAYLAKALVVFPGGFGTFDELFELLTLVQTGKTAHRVPVVLYGSEYWNEIMDFGAMVKWGVIGPEDLDLFRFCDEVDDAFEFLKQDLSQRYS